ncbi:MAG: molecular chaperone TorD [Methyloligellaceae bacterium]
MIAVHKGDTAAARAQLYALLAAIFRGPLDAGQVEALRQPEMLAALRAAGIDPGPDFAASPCAEIREKLAIDFTHVFHHPEGKVMPYEGLMLAVDDELGGKRREAVERFLADVGYRVPPERGEMADHIAVELEFVADLARREAEAHAQGDQTAAARARDIQRAFLSEHLGRWVDALAEQVSDRSETAFYRNLARALARFVQDDRDALCLEPQSA